MNRVIKTRVKDGAEPVVTNGPGEAQQDHEEPDYEALDQIRALTDQTTDSLRTI